MKAILFVFAIIETVYSISGICSNGGMYISHPTDCSKFIQCFNGKPIEFLCMAGFYWNPARAQCDWEWNVKCLVKCQI